MQTITPCLWFDSNGGGGEILHLHFQEFEDRPDRGTEKRATKSTANRRERC